MAKFGYVCKCGWKLERGKLTRQQYAAQKQVHAGDGSKLHGVDMGCPSLRLELKASKAQT